MLKIDQRFEVNFARLSQSWFLFRSTACLCIFVFGSAFFFLGVNEQVAMKICCRHSHLQSLTMRKRHGNFRWATLFGSLPDRWICQRQESGRPLWASTVCWKYHSKTVSMWMLVYGFVCFFFFKLVNSCPALGAGSDWLLNQFTVVNRISAYLEWITVKLLRLGCECRCRMSVLPVSLLILHMTKMKALQSWHEVGFWVKSWSVEDNQVLHSDQGDGLCIY